ncbi:MAG: phosphodiester glycosidase family protein [Clostridia bacterium]|nr:phosphodiester glycosidase family protein [Clostridia bacterium]
MVKNLCFILLGVFLLFSCAAQPPAETALTEALTSPESVTAAAAADTTGLSETEPTPTTEPLTEAVTSTPDTTGAPETEPSTEPPATSATETDPPAPPVTSAAPVTTAVPMTTTPETTAQVPPETFSVQEITVSNTVVTYIGTNARPQLVIAQGGVNSRETIQSYAARTGASILVNGGMWNTDGTACGATIIGDTIYQILDEYKMHGSYNNNEILTYFADGHFESVRIASESDWKALRKRGAEWCVKGCIPLIRNKKDVIWDDNTVHARSFIAQDVTGTYWVGATGGSGYGGPGIKYADLRAALREAIDEPLLFLYALDGGGSSHLWAEGRKCNPNVKAENRAVVNVIAFWE